MFWWTFLFACQAPAPSEGPTAGTPTPSTSTVPTADSATAGSPTADSSPDTVAPTADSTSPWSGEPTASPYVLRSGPPPDTELFLSIDTTRADRLNGNGYTGAVTSPHVDALLDRGLALRHHYSCSSWTIASFLCLLTARDQLTLGYWPDNHTGSGIAPYPTDDLPSLARQLSDEGFATSLVTGNSLISTNFNMSQGHDTVKRTFSAPETAQEGIAALERLTDEGDRWFLHVHFMDPHTPYDAPGAFRTKGTDCVYDVADIDAFHELRHGWEALSADDQAACQAHLTMLYDGLIAHTDAQLQRVVDALEASDAADTTLILFATDHGEAFFEHGDWEHGHDLHNELQRATAGLVYPPRIAPAVHSELTAHQDLVPTLREALDLPPLAEATGVPIGSAPVDVVHGLVYRNVRTVQSVTTPTGRLQYRWDGAAWFHAADDLAEVDDLYDLDDPEVQAHWSLLRPQIDELASRVTDGSVPLGLP